MTKDEFIELMKSDLYIETDEICDMIVKLEDIKLDILTHYFFENEIPNCSEGWFCNISEHEYNENFHMWFTKEHCKVLSCNSMRDAIISCICKKFNIGD